MTWLHNAATVVRMKTVSVRLPDDIHDRIKATAELDRRSLNGEILWLLEQGLDARDIAAES